MILLADTIKGLNEQRKFMSDVLKAWTIAIGAAVSLDAVRADQVLTLGGSIALLVIGVMIAIYGSVLAISLEDVSLGSKPEDDGNAPH